MNKKLAERMKKARKQAGYSQSEIAELLDIVHSTYNKYEKGHREPSADLIRRMAIKTEVNPGWLLTGEEPDSIDIYNKEERREVEKLLRILRTKQQKTVSAIRQNLDAFLDNPDKKTGAVHEGTSEAATTYEAAEQAAAYNSKKKNRC